MFTGTLIEELMATVERAEQYDRSGQERELHISETWRGIGAHEFSRPANHLLGVA